MIMVSKMMNFFFFLSVIFLSSSFSLNEYQKTPKTIYNIRQIVSSYPEDKLIKNLRTFASCCKSGRLVGTGSHDKAYDQIKKMVQNYIDKRINILDHEFSPDVDYAMMSYRDQLEKALEKGLEREGEDFKKIEHFANQRIGLLEELRSTKGKNLIWEKRGNNKKAGTLILMAHYDNAVFKDTDKGKVVATESQMPGADKNASGVALLLSLIEILHQVDLPKTVRFVFLDFGEFENLGAKAYVDRWKGFQSGEKVFGAINVMMVGHSSKNNHENDLEHDMRLYYKTTAEGSTEGLKFAKFIKKLGDQMGTPVNTEIGTWERPTGGQRYFWENDIPAFLYSHNWELDSNPRVHTSNDFVETLNFKTLHGNLRYLSGAILAWAFELD
jgi:hypothetical protein